MSDILLYNAIAENQRLLKAYVLKTIDPSSPSDITYYTSNSIAGDYNSYIYGSATAQTVTQCPPMVRSWLRLLTPVVGQTKSNGFKVCDTSGYFRCGAVCTFTVPAGVTCVQFQIWGHGGGNSGQCCCGGTPFGPTGSYMSVCTSVTPGEVFCLCAGCAYCCYATQTTPTVSAVSSFVCSGSGGFYALAMGATSCICAWRASIPGVTSSGCQMPTNDGCGPESCAGWNFCWDSGADNSCIPQSFSTSETWCLCCNTRTATAYGLPVIYPGLVIGGDLSSPGGGWHISPPVFGFESCTCCWGNNTLSTVGSLCTGYGGCFYQAINGYQQIPAVGAFAGWTCGGYNSGCGDVGGMGMVCVSW